MTTYLILTAIVMIACVIFHKISSKLGIPMLLAFILLGMFFGSDGLVKIPFDNYNFAEQICSVALVFIMFYGGFGTKWSEAKPVAGKAVLLSSFGTIVTAGLVGMFCYFVLHIDLLESFLIGSVISSTDAASVFSILRSQRLNLRYHTASVLEVESGSNDPVAYMLTVIMLSLMGNGKSGGEFVYLVFAQLVYGAVFGSVTAVLAYQFLKRVKITTSGFDAVFLVAVALIAYAAPTYFGGNGYLSVYLTGIILGNLKTDNKQALVHFFDGITSLMQMLLFFLLGLLAFPSRIPEVALTALAIAVFLTFVARPVAVFLILSPFKSPIRQQLLISWSGMRGAASIVFAIMAVIQLKDMKHDLFHMVFFIVLFSILIQGSLIPFVAKRLNMTDIESDVMKTFTDYSDEIAVQFIQCQISQKHPWVGKTISEIVLPPELILVLLIHGRDKIVPRGKTVLCKDDILVLSGKSPDHIEGVRLYEKEIHKKSGWAGKRLAQIPSGANLIILIQRGEEIIIPQGTTIVQAGDRLVINEASATK